MRPRLSSWNVRRFYRVLRASDTSCAAIARAATVEGSNPIFNELVRRSVSDIYMLSTNTEHGPYPFAGIPWFSTLFGRDGIVTALLTCGSTRRSPRACCGFSRRRRPMTADAERDAEPGKILHEMRHGEMARLGEVPFGRYYGTVDATPLS